MHVGVQEWGPRSNRCVSGRTPVRAIRAGAGGGSPRQWVPSHLQPVHKRAHDLQFLAAHCHTRYHALGFPPSLLVPCCPHGPTPTGQPPPHRPTPRNVLLPGSAVHSPTMRPNESSSGPPELPPLTTASVYGHAGHVGTGAEEVERGLRPYSKCHCAPRALLTRAALAASCTLRCMGLHSTTGMQLGYAAAPPAGACQARKPILTPAPALR